MGRWVRFDRIDVALDNLMDGAIVKGARDTLKEAAEEARSNHPGWKNVTGKAERSIRSGGMVRHGDHYTGGFGSYGVAYFIFLEIGTRFHKADHTLRRAADRVFPRLQDNIRKYL